MPECCETQLSTNHKESNGENGQLKTLKQNCPMCETKSFNVAVKTILLHVKQPWLQKLNDSSYFYCSNPKCVVVYFSTTGKVIYKTELRIPLGVKEEDDEALICFCFGVSKAEASTNKKIRNFVIQQTKQGSCSCETANPSGRCCLKDFSKS